jgi:hypothetical protein
MPNKSANKKGISKSFRFTEEEWARIEVLFSLGKKRQAYASDTDIFKEIVGINPLKALTEQDIHRFRKQADAADRTHVLPPKTGTS